MTANSLGALYHFKIQWMRSRGRATSVQFTVASTQHFLYFFPEPHGRGSFRPYLGCSGDVPKCDHAPRLPMRPEILMPPDIPAAVCTMSSSLVEGVGAENRFLHLCPGVSPREYASEEAVKEHVVIGKG
jgi:hypothetical protein